VSSSTPGSTFYNPSRPIWAPTTPYDGPEIGGRELAHIDECVRGTAADDLTDGLDVRHLLAGQVHQYHGVQVITPIDERRAAAPFRK
jgi:hypothetical protein